MAVSSRGAFDAVRARWLPQGEQSSGIYGISHLPDQLGDGAYHPTGHRTTDVRAELNSARGLLVAIADMHGSTTPVSQHLIDDIVRTYSDIPPDIDRLVALRATLDRAVNLMKELLPTDAQANPAQLSRSVLVSTISQGQLYMVSSGACRSYHVRANGRIDPIRLEPTAQRALEVGDSVLWCSSGLSEKLDDYDMALALYSRSPQNAARHLLNIALKKGTQSALIAVVFGPQRSLLQSVFGRSINK